MAVPRGSFQAGAAGVSGPGGAYVYITGSGFSLFYGGTFFIDTGYDDPVLWTTGVDCAEVYGARVYGKAGVTSPAAAPGEYTGKWHVSATPVWGSKFWGTPHANTETQQRVLIKCDVFLSEPFSESDGHYQRQDSVDWSLYRV